MDVVNPVSLDIVWTLIATALVFLMQMGFALLESGAARAKNSINIIMKNVMDISLGPLSILMLLLINTATFLLFHKRKI